MCHKLLRDASLFARLWAIDCDIAREVREAGCLSCGARLDTANYPRKPRGGPDELDVTYSKRLSFCCAAEGCRRRATPASVRFLGRRVYLAVVVVLATAMVHGVTERRAAVLCGELEVSLETVERWRRWWQEWLPGTPYWRTAKGRFRSPPDRSRLPVSLWEAFTGGEADRIVRLLRFLGPLTTSAPVS